MDKQITVIWLIVLLCALLLSGPAIAMESNNYAIKWDAMAGGDGSVQSASYAINSTIGQPVIGFETSAGYQLGAGYWYGVTVEHAIYLPLIMRN